MDRSVSQELVDVDQVDVDHFQIGGNQTFDELAVRLQRREHYDPAIEFGDYVIVLLHICLIELC